MKAVHVPSCIFSISRWSDRLYRWTRLDNTASTAALNHYETRNHTSIRLQQRTRHIQRYKSHLLQLLEQYGKLVLIVYCELLEQFTVNYQN